MRTIEQDGVMMRVNMLTHEGRLSFASEVRDRLNRRRDKKVLGDKPLDYAAQTDWWIALYASWLAMYEEHKQ